MSKANSQRGVSQIVMLVSIAVVLAVAYLALDLYGGGQKEMAMTEARGMQAVVALSAYKRDQGSYPDELAKLVPKYAPAAPKCPSGAPMEYRASAGEYALSCLHVVFRYLPYNYDSRSKSWGG
jgi:hypothetical protein